VKLLAKIAARLALLCFGIIAALAIGEVALRVAGLAKPAFYTYDRYRGWGLRPGAAGWNTKEGEAYVSINREGFRGPETAAAKPPNTIRIAVLGDSFTEAQQLDEDKTFSAVIGRELARCPALGGRKVEVLNLGVNGYGTTQELMTLRYQAWQFSPDIVVLAIFTGNDIVNNSIAMETERCRPFYVYRDGEMAPAGPLFDSPVSRAQCMMRFESRLRFDPRQSQVVKMIDAGWRAVRDRLPGKHHRDRDRGDVIGSELGINDLVYKPPADQQWRDAWHVTDGIIEQMNREVKAHGAAFLAVTLTTSVQVWPDPAISDLYMRRLGVNNLWYPDQRIEALGQRDGFAVLALAPPMSAYAREHHVFLHGFKNTKIGEGHWNELGHRVGGELIAAKLCQMIRSGQVPALAKTAAH
jgi:hypothetical protein